MEPSASASVLFSGGRLLIGTGVRWPATPRSFSLSKRRPSGDVLRGTAASRRLSHRHRPSDCRGAAGAKRRAAGGRHVDLKLRDREDGRSVAEALAKAMFRSSSPRRIATPWEPTFSTAFVRPPSCTSGYRRTSCSEPSAAPSNDERAVPKRRLAATGSERRGVAAVRFSMAVQLWRSRWTSST